MKRFLVLVVVALFGVALFSSCKTVDCPAYSQADQIQVEQPA
jgi:outer membrane protein assembly factor BamE (lipoprotein component of BamABCDE complex)